MQMRMSDNQKNLISPNEVTILRCMQERADYFKQEANDDAINEVVVEINEISARTGIRDNDEVLRALYTLEGKQLVSPFPKGDFTSSKWKITGVGERAIELLEEAALAAANEG